VPTGVLPAAQADPTGEPKLSPVTAIAETNPEAAQFIQDWLGMLIEHDVREPSELVATLAAFLEHNHDHDSTARALGIHRSTARYRIHRVAQLTQLDLRDPETARSLRVASNFYSAFRRTVEGSSSAILSGPGSIRAHGPGRRPS
jgi:DNA-binding PucR family transcriptional regulator